MPPFGRGRGQFCFILFYFGFPFHSTTLPPPLPASVAQAERLTGHRKPAHGDGPTSKTVQVQKRTMNRRVSGPCFQQLVDVKAWGNPHESGTISLHRGHHGPGQISGHGREGWEPHRKNNATRYRVPSGDLIVQNRATERAQHHPTARLVLACTSYNTRHMRAVPREAQQINTSSQRWAGPARTSS